MKFPSIRTLGQSINKTLLRFPFEIAFALAGTIAATISLHRLDYGTWLEGSYLRAVMTANLGLLLSFSMTLFLESRDIRGAKKWGAKSAIAIGAACLFFAINPQHREFDHLRFWAMSLGFHLLVSFAPFTSKGQVQGFWQFNRALFIRFLTSVLYSGFLYLGLVIALEAIKLLFNISIGDHTFVNLWFWIAGIFNTMFFLAGVPADTRTLEEDTFYPKDIKIFTQYVLIPLATVYLLILLVYEGKIAVQWSLPKGYVSNLILGYAVFGILAILLIYPIREDTGNKWIKTYTRSFYFLMIPLIILLLFAIGSRVLPYGITVPRYYLMALAIWLVFITAYFLLSKKQNIKLIPVTLCILTLLSIYGPVSAFSVASYSQRNILVSIFKKYGAYKGGHFTPLNKTKVTEKDGIRAQGVIEYLVENDGLSFLQPYVAKDLDRVSDSLSVIKTKEKKDAYYTSAYFRDYEIRSQKMDWAKKYLGLDQFGNLTSSFTNYYFTTSAKQLLDIKGYDYVFEIPDSRSDTDTVSFNSAHKKMVFITDSTQNSVVIVDQEKVKFDMKALADSLMKNQKLYAAFKDTLNPAPGNYRSFSLPAGGMSITSQTSHYVITFKIGRLDFLYNGTLTTVNSVAGYYLIKAK